MWGLGWRGGAGCFFFVCAGANVGAGIAETRVEKQSHPISCYIIQSPSPIFIIFHSQIPSIFLPFGRSVFFFCAALEGTPNVMIFPSNSPSWHPPTRFARRPHEIQSDQSTFYNPFFFYYFSSNTARFVLSDPFFRAHWNVFFVQGPDNEIEQGVTLWVIDSPSCIMADELSRPPRAWRASTLARGRRRWW